MFKSITLEVIGNQTLHCESCERRVERLLKSLQGVGKVHAHADNQHIEVLFDTAVLEPSAIADRLSDVGYETKTGSSASDSAN